jgi:hypothetical protein
MDSSTEVEQTHGMGKRLQVLLDQSELTEMRRTARRHKLTIAAWVPQVLRTARRAEAGSHPGKKLAVVRAAARHRFPTADIDPMLAEIERGYLGPRRSCWATGSCRRGTPSTPRS